MSADRPNILIVTLHDLGRQLRCYDPAAPETPALQRLAAEGVVFENHFSTCSLCSPARSSIQTGRYPHSNGVDGLTHRGFALKDDERCMAQYFNDLGYHTALYGLQHEVHGNPARLGYREMCVRPEYSHHAMEIVPHACDFLQRRHEQPFLLSLGFSEVHRHFKRDYVKPVDPASVPVPPYLIDCPEVHEDLSWFYGMAQVADRAMKELLDCLDRTRLSERTLLLFTTDHGFAFPRAKSTLYDPGIGVTLLARRPGSLPAGARVRGLTSHVDILPTLLELAGGVPDERVQGRSFAPVLNAPSAAGRGEVFAEKSWHGNEYDPMRCVRTERYKYIRNFTEGFLYQSPLDIKSGLSGRVMEESRRKPRAMTELYDLAADPWEMTNLSGRPDLAEVESRLDRTLSEWMRRTGDSLPARHIPWPQPGKEHYLNNMDCPMPEAKE